MPRPKQRTSKSPSRSDRICWNAYKRERKSFEQIATEQNMSLAAVGNAIQRMDEYRCLVSEDEVNLAINEIALAGMKKVGSVITKAMDAKIVTRERVGENKSGNAKYKTFSRPDHATHLKAVETFKALIESTRPKGGGVNIALQQNNGGGGGGGDIRPQGHSFEERLRRAREQRGLKDEVGIVDAEEIEASTLADELGDIGIDLEDEEDGEEVDEEDDEDGEGSA